MIAYVMPLWANYAMFYLSGMLMGVGLVVIVPDISTRISTRRKEQDR